LIIKSSKLKPASVDVVILKDRSVPGKESGAPGQNHLSFRQRCTGLSGKAKHIDPEASIFIESESEQDTKCFRRSKTAELMDMMATNSTSDVL
jgi:hypothetical protein